MYKYLPFLLLLFLVGCEDSTSATTAKKKKEIVIPKAEPTPTQPTEPLTEKYPALPAKQAKKLFLQTDYIDYLFYDLPYSMSHEEKKDIQNAIRYISTSPVMSNIPDCASIGRIFYQKKGNVIREAEFHFNNQQGCYYLVFLEDGKPTYANLLTRYAVNNYNNIFGQVKIDK